MKDCENADIREIELLEKKVLSSDLDIRNQVIKILFSRIKYFVVDKEEILFKNQEIESLLHQVAGLRESLVKLKANNSKIRQEKAEIFVQCKFLSNINSKLIGRTDCNQVILH